jgi:hypothetical protein
MTITLDATRTPQWTKVSDDLTSGAFDGNYAGVIERVGERWEARDAFGALVGSFASEREAQAAFEPAALTEAYNARERRERIMAAITSVVAAATTVVTALGFMTLAGS